MKKRYILFGSIAFMQFTSSAQPKRDTIDKVNKTQIDLVYNNYFQDGNNSAVTGGTGTEKLSVYGPAVTYKKTIHNSSIKCNLGVDIISSASTDNIDYVMSSASALDTRTYVNAAYEQQLEKSNSSIYGGMGMSIESDYLSIGSQVGFTKENTKTLSQYSLELSMFNDDLRWGRLTKGRPIRLIYPVELRNQEWHNGYRRNSFNLKMGYTQVINKRSIFGLFPVISYQQGLLATPFHRVYFSDGTQGVEQFPDHRIKGSVAIKWNQFIRGNIISKNTINPYIDNFGIISFSIENETAIKLSPIWTLLPNGRIYIQKGSDYFAAFENHDPDSDFHTSDYDYSSLQNYNLGIGFKYAPFEKILKRLQFNQFIFRYNYMHRSDGLKAHILTLSIQSEWDKKKK